MTCGRRDDLTAGSPPRTPPAPPGVYWFSLWMTDPTICLSTAGMALRRCGRHRWANLPNWRRSRVLGSPFSGSYLAAEVTDFTAMVSPLAVPVTLACSQASLLSSSSAA